MTDYRDLSMSQPGLADTDIARMAKALGHPVRIAILRILSEQECVCGKIVDGLPLAQSTVSQHLKLLKEAGWISGVIDGPHTCYALRTDAIAALRLVLGPLLERWEGAARPPVDSSCL